MTPSAPPVVSQDDAAGRLRLLALGCAVSGLDHLPVVDRANASAFAADINAILAERTALRSLLADALGALEPFAYALKGNFSHQDDALLLDVGFGSDKRWKHTAGQYRRAHSTAIAIRKVIHG